MPPPFELLFCWALLTAEGVVISPFPESTGRLELIAGETEAEEIVDEDTEEMDETLDVEETVGLSLRIGAIEELYKSRRSSCSRMIEPG